MKTRTRVLSLLAVAALVGSALSAAPHPAAAADPLVAMIVDVGSGVGPSGNPTETFDAAVSGGQSPYAYFWYWGMGNPLGSTASVTIDSTCGVAPASISLQITDTVGAATTTSATVTCGSSAGPSPTPTPGSSAG